MELQLWRAAQDGEVGRVMEILGSGGVDVNWRNDSDFGNTALHMACWNGHDAIVALLLAHPDIRVNQRTEVGEIPFMAACCGGNTTSIWLLLRDLRVQPNECDLEGYSPLWWAAYYGQIDLIKWWIASRREVILDMGSANSDALAEARNEGKLEVASLLERFQAAPGDTRRGIRQELGLYDVLAADLFAIALFWCDDLLRITETTRGEDSLMRAKRFLRITKRLPMELQMLLCYRIVGSMRSNIPLFEREAAFRDLARRLLPNPYEE